MPTEQEPAKPAGLIVPETAEPAAPEAKPADTNGQAPPAPKETKKRRKRRLRRLFRVGRWGLFTIVLILIGVRAALPKMLTWYVNATIDRNPLYDGKIGDVDLHLWRGAYSIEDIRIIKTTGNVPVPLFAAKRVDLSIQWDTVLNGKIVGVVDMAAPELNFVDGEEEAEDQTGAGGPWLEIIQDLFPFKINSARLRDGSVHFRAFASDPPVDMYVSNVEATIENLGNIRDEITPLVATVEATGLVLDHADLALEMKVDPFSYRPTFELAVRLVGLDVTKTNPMTRAYGAFDFEYGWFDLVVELEAREGGMEGYVKPLFRNLQVLSLKKDVPEDNILGVFWEALVGLTSELLENQPRNQFATVIPMRGDLSDPKTDILAILGNVLRNAFVRAYLPRLQGTTEELGGMEFAPGSVTDPSAVGSAP